MKILTSDEKIAAHSAPNYDGNGDYKMTMKHWKNKHREQKSIIDKVRWCTALDPTTGGTCLVPVEIVKSFS